MLQTVFLLATFVHLGSAGAPSCATQAAIDTMNNDINAMVGGLVTANLVTVDQGTGAVNIPDANIPTILDTLCTTTDLKNKMLAIETAIANCQDLLTAQGTNLALLKIKGVAFTDMFAAFGDVDNFCSCRTPLPHAWALQAQAMMLAHQDPNAAYTKIAAVNNLCGATLKPVIQSIGGRPDSDTCKAALLRQAGYTTEEDEMKLDHLKMFVDSGCDSYQLTDWTCVTDKAKMAEFKTCISDVNNLTGDKASCAKRKCVMDDMDCTDAAREMYIKAVNLEMKMEIKEKSMAGDCNSAPAMYLSLLAVAACLLVLFA